MMQQCHRISAAAHIASSYVVQHLIGVVCSVLPWLKLQGVQGVKISLFVVVFFFFHFFSIKMFCICNIVVE